jgi:hypothetical protein
MRVFRPKYGVSSEGFGFSPVPRVKAPAVKYELIFELPKFKMPASCPDQYRFFRINESSELLIFLGDRFIADQEDSSLVEALQSIIRYNSYRIVPIDTAKVQTFAVKFGERSDATMYFWDQEALLFKSFTDGRPLIEKRSPSRLLSIDFRTKFFVSDEGRVGNDPKGLYFHSRANNVYHLKNPLKPETWIQGAVVTLASHM